MTPETPTPDDRTAVREALRDYVERAALDEVRQLVEAFAESLARRVGTFAPFVHAAIGGIMQALARAAASARPEPPGEPPRPGAGP